MPENKWGEKLRHVREDVGLTLDVAANTIGIKPERLTEYANASDIAADTVAEILHAYGHTLLIVDNNK